MKPHEKPVVALRVSFTALIPNGIASEQQITEWLDFVLGRSSAISFDNPLHEHPLESLRSCDWQPLAAGVIRQT